MRKIGWLLALLVLCAACAGESAPPPDNTAAQTLEACRLPQDSVRYHIVVDRSGSMLPHWPMVRTQLAQIMDSIPNRGVVQVSAFSDQVLTEIRDRQKLPETGAELHTRALAVRSPEPSGPTDLGVALESAADAVEEARRRGRGRVNFVFIVTDGKHDPAAGSRFGGAGAEASFDVLRQRWAGLEQKAEADLIVRAVPVGSAGLEGARRILSTIHDAVALPAQAPDELGATIGAELRNAEKNLLRERVTPEVEQPRIHARLVPSPQTIGLRGSDPVRVLLRSSASCVTYEVAQPTGTGWVALAPGDSVVTEVAVRSPRHWWSAWPWQGVREENNFRLTLRIAPQPAKEMIRLNVDPHTRTAQVEAAGTIRYAPMRWVTFLLLLALLTWFAWLARRLTAAPATGRFEPTRAARGLPALRDLSPYRANGAHRYTLPGADGVTVMFDRISRLASPARVRMTVAAQGSLRVATTRENDAGKLVPEPLRDGERRVLDEGSYILWLPLEKKWPAKMSEGQVSNYPGYEWIPPK